jgi:hypothetical protein
MQLLEEGAAEEPGFGDAEELLDQQDMMNEVQQQLHQEISQALPEGWDVMGVVVKDAPAAPPAAALEAGPLPLCSYDLVEAGGLPIADAFHLEPVALADRLDHSGVNSSSDLSSSWGSCGLLELHCASAPLEHLQQQGYSYLRVVLAENKGAPVVVADVKQAPHGVCKLGGIRMRLDQQHQQEALFRHAERTKWLGLVVLAGGEEEKLDAASASALASAPASSLMAAAADVVDQAAAGRRREVLLCTLPVPVLPGGVVEELQQLLERAVMAGIPVATAYQQVILPVLADMLIVLHDDSADTSSNSTSSSGIATAAEKGGHVEDPQAKALASLLGFVDLHGLLSLRELLLGVMRPDGSKSVSLPLPVALAAIRGGGDEAGNVPASAAASGGVRASGPANDVVKGAGEGHAGLLLGGLGKQLQQDAKRAGLDGERGPGSGISSCTSRSSIAEESSQHGAGWKTASSSRSTMHGLCSSDSEWSSCWPDASAMQRQAASAALAGVGRGSFSSSVSFWWICISGALWGWRDARLESTYCSSCWPHSHTSNALRAVYDILMVVVGQARLWSAMWQGSISAVSKQSLILVWMAHTVPAVLFGVWSLLCIRRCWCLQYRGVTAAARDGLQAAVHVLHNWMSPQGVVELARMMGDARALTDNPFFLYLATALLIGTLHVVFQRLPPPWLLPCAALNVVLLGYIMYMHDVMLSSLGGMCCEERGLGIQGLVTAYAEVSVWVRATAVVGLGVVLVVWQEARSRARFLSQAATTL